MYEDDFAPTRKHEVRLARQIRAVQPVPIAYSENELANDHLRFRVLGVDRRHNKRAFRPVYMVHSSPVPPEKRRLSFDVLLCRFPHNPRQRHFLLSSDVFQHAIDGRWKADRRPDGCSRWFVRTNSVGFGANFHAPYYTILVQPIALKAGNSFLWSGPTHYRAPGMFRKESLLVGHRILHLVITYYRYTVITVYCVNGGEH